MRAWGRSHDERISRGSGPRRELKDKRLVSKVINECPDETDYV